MSRNYNTMTHLHWCCCRRVKIRRNLLTRLLSYLQGFESHKLVNHVLSICTSVVSSPLITFTPLSSSLRCGRGQPSWTVERSRLSCQLRPGRFPQPGWISRWELVLRVPEVNQTDNLNTLKELFQSSGLHDTAVLARPLTRTNHILKNVHPD